MWCYDQDFQQNRLQAAKVRKQYLRIPLEKSYNQLVNI